MRERVGRRDRWFGVLDMLVVGRIVVVVVDMLLRLNMLMLVK